MKKLKKLKINKVTLQNLDETSLQGVAGGGVTAGNTVCNTNCDRATACMFCASIAGC